VTNPQAGAYSPFALVLNTRRPPFNDLRVRQALNYAVDRNLVARLLGQDSQPACQLLPPYIPGYQRYCPYTLNANPRGGWSAPNLAKARALIAASKTRGTPITIWVQESTFNVDFPSTGRYIQALLDSLGYPTTIRTFSEPDTRFFSGIADSRTAPAANFGLGLPLYPAASQFLYGGYGCKNFIPDSTSNANYSEWCDPRFDAIVNQALAAEAAGAPSAALWARADRQLTDQAPLVDLTNPSTTDLVSRRVGNYQYNPQLGVLIDQLWVR
jgi:peptide/nickel transport system substrate-binding protein